MSYPIPDDARFFRDGVVELLACDYNSRMALLSLTMPCCLFQSVTPHLLNGGSVSRFRLLEPLSVWMPTLTEQCCKTDQDKAKSFAAGVNVALKEEALKTIRLFENLKPYLKEPSDIIPILPLGIYIQFDWSISIDKIAEIIVGINSIYVTGIVEFQVALTCTMNMILEEFSLVLANSKRLTTPET